MAKEIKGRLVNKHDIEENWLKAENFTPLAGEKIIYDPDSTHFAARVKVGDGKTNVNDLPFVNNITAGEGVGSVILGDGVENHTGGMFNIAAGCGNLAGHFGYKVTSLDLENKTITLDKTDDDLLDPYGIYCLGIGLYNGYLALIESEPIDSEISSQTKNAITYNNINNSELVEFLSHPEFYQALEESGGIALLFDIANPKQGNLGLSIGSIAAGVGSMALADLSLAIGGQAQAFAEGAISIGMETQASGKNSVALGYKTEAIGEGAVAIGQTFVAEGVGTESMTAYGPVVARGDNSFAGGIGTYKLERINEYVTLPVPVPTEAKGKASFAFGEGVQANGDHSVAFGERTQANGDHSVAFGDGTKAEEKDSIAFGGYNQGGKYTFTENNDEFEEIITIQGRPLSVKSEGQASFASGQGTIAKGKAAHAEGLAENFESGEYEYEFDAGIRTKELNGEKYAAFGDASHVEGYNTTAYTLATHAEGIKGRAGCRGYYYDAVCFDSTKGIAYFHLSNNQVEDSSKIRVYEDWVAMVTEENQELLYEWNIADGDLLNIINKSKYYQCEVVSAKENVPNKHFIALKVPFSSITTQLKENMDLDDFAITNPAEPHIGTAEIKKASHAEGWSNISSGDASHAEGHLTNAYGDYAHAEGWSTLAWDHAAHAEGVITKALQKGAHAEGWEAIADGIAAHSEGYATKAESNYAHAEGYSTVAGVKGEDTATAHAEGYQSKALGHSSHAEGRSTQATAYGAHSEGRETVASALHAHAEGYKAQATGQESHAEGNGTIASGLNSHAQGTGSKSYGRYSHSEGYQSVAGTQDLTNNATSQAQHAEGYQTQATGNYAHSEGYQTKALHTTTHAEGQKSEAHGDSAHAEGFQTKAYGNRSHVEGSKNQTGKPTYNASGQLISNAEGAHAEGKENFAYGIASHAEGWKTTAISNYTHTEGYNTVAGVEGEDTPTAHAEGYNTKATGHSSHAEGRETLASGYASHASGRGTIASGQHQTAIGQFNKENSDALFIVGNGSSLTDRNNAFEVLKNGTALVGGKQIATTDQVGMKEVGRIELMPYGATSFEFILSDENGIDAYYTGESWQLSMSSGYYPEWNHTRGNDLLQLFLNSKMIKVSLKLAPGYSPSDRIQNAFNAYCYISGGVMDHIQTEEMGDRFDGRNQVTEAGLTMVTDLFNLASYNSCSIAYYLNLPDSIWKALTTAEYAADAGIFYYPSSGGIKFEFIGYN